MNLILSVFGMTVHSFLAVATLKTFLREWWGSASVFKILNFKIGKLSSKSILYVCKDCHEFETLCVVL